MNNRYQLIFMVFTVYAGTAVAASLGEVSANMMAPMTGLARIIHAISYATGAGFLIGSLLQYKQYRDNPQQVRLSKPLTWLFLGMILIAIPFLTDMYSESAQLVR